MNFKSHYTEGRTISKEFLIAQLDIVEKGLKEVRTNIIADTDMTDRHARQELKKVMQELRKLDKRLT